MQLPIGEENSPNMVEPKIVENLEEMKSIIQTAG